MQFSVSDREMALRKVLIINKSYPTAGLELLKKNGFQPTVLPFMDHYPNAEAEIVKNLGLGYDALIWNTKFKLTAELMDLASPQLKAISTMSSGLDHIDLDAVMKRGLLLGNTPKALDNSVADITVGLMIAAARRFKEGVRMVENGDWKPGVQWLLGQDIAGSTVGIVGFGGIGQAIARRLRGFDVARFLYSGRSDKPEAKDLVAERVPVEQLLRESDYVILCCPLTNKTKHLINANTLKIMKRTAVLVNIARGDVIDHDALATALKENTIFAAGLDVTTPEPLPHDNPLVALKNCYIIPHLGSATVQTRNNMACIAASNVISALEGKPMQFPVFQ